MPADLAPGVLRRAAYERQGQARLPLFPHSPTCENPNMNVTVSAKDFAPAAAQAARICNTVTTLPVLRNVLLEVSGGQLRIAATDLESTLDIRLPAEGAADGAVTVSAKTLSQLVGSLGNSELKLASTDKEQLNVTARSGEYTLAGLSPEEFPPVTNPAEACPCTLDAGVLRDALLQCLPYPDPTDTRVAMKSVRVLASDGSLLFSAMSGSQYSRRIVAVPGFAGDYEALLPVGSAREIAELLKGAGDCRICADAHQFSVYVGGTTYSTRVFEGKVGNVEKRFAGRNPHVAGVSRDELAAALKRLLLVADPKSIVHPVTLEFTPDELTLTARTDQGTVRETLALLDVQGDPNTYRLNAHLLLTAIQALRADTLQFHFADDAMAPACLRPSHDAEQQVWMASIRPDASGD